MARAIIISGLQVLASLPEFEFALMSPSPLNVRSGSNVSVYVFSAILRKFTRDRPVDVYFLLLHTDIHGF